MKKFLITLLVLMFSFVLISCGKDHAPSINTPNNPSRPNQEILPPGEEPKSETNEDINENPGEVDVLTDYQITFVSGTNNAYTIDNNTIRFTNLSSDSVYSISGSLDGNIVIDVGNDYKFELEFNGFTITSNIINPITILSGNEVQITAKKDTLNYVYDYRMKIDSNDDTLYRASIYSLVDLDLGGKGRLEVYSENNNGIHTKDDLKVKNLSLNVVCMDNALKGNDSVTIESGNVKLVSKAGDGIKTTNSHINTNENQKGNVIIGAATVDIYA